MSPPSASLGLQLERSNTILYCLHWLATVTFYRERLSLPVSFESDWFVEFELTATAFLSIADAARATIAPVAGQGITLSLRVAEVEPLRRQLMERGVEGTSLQRKWGALLFYVTDPEGHRLEFWQPLDPLESPAGAPPP